MRCKSRRIFFMVNGRSFRLLYLSSLTVTQDFPFVIFYFSL